MTKIKGDVDENGDFSHDKDLKILFASNCKRSVTVEVKRWYPVRTNQQNKAVMGLWMSMIMKETGHHPHEYDAVYYGIKSQCWYTDQVSKITGEVIRLPRGTKGLDKAEYSQFMRCFRVFVLDFFGIFLPDPVKSLELI